jgi:DNA-binding transcriptional MerR regulator
LTLTQREGRYLVYQDKKLKKWFLVYGVNKMSEKLWKIGELSIATGVTIRALHHYHDKGLLIPSEISEAGYRLYTKNDIIKLQQIIALKRFSFSLDEIKNLLERKTFDPIKIIENHLKIIDEEIKTHLRIKSQLENFSTILHNSDAKVDDFIKLIGVFSMDEITLEVGLQLVPLVEKSKGGKILEIISNLRQEKVFPQIRIRDNTLLNENEYRFIVKGKETFRSECNISDLFSKENIDGIVRKLEEIIEGYNKEE